MTKQLNPSKQWLTRGLGLTAAGAFALISACGGGSVGFDPAGGATSTPTPTASATPTNTPIPQPYTVLHTFDADGSKGEGPASSLVADSNGDFYGTTYFGGAYNMGTAYRITRTGDFQLLHSFSGSDGGTPHAALVADGLGNFYGTTYSGGADNLGTVYKITRAGAVSPLHSFAGSDGANPYAALVADGEGNFYGTTYGGGASNLGAVYKITSAGVVSVLHSFAGGNSDGAQPYAGLVADSSGNLYGTTLAGGVNSLGTVFKMLPTGTGTFTFNLLHSFAGSDGSTPFAALVPDSAGNYYGTTYFGGANAEGTVYKITSLDDFTVVHSFAADGSAGVFPLAGLVADGAGNFYGTTSRGGTDGFSGTVFKMTSTGDVTVLHNFGAPSDGVTPYAAPLVSDGLGSFYGTTINGGANNKGTVFRIPMQ